MPMNQHQNILPSNGELLYLDAAIDPKKSLEWEKQLEREISWQRDVVKLFGKTIVTKRKVAWYGDRKFQYTYSGKVKTAMLWSDNLKIIKQKVEEICGEHFNSCLANFYENGDVGMGWHCDNEKELVKHGTIASLSLGAKRDFILKHKFNNTKLTCNLENGSLLLMKGEIQDYWLHSLPKRKKISESRVNLTFRNINT